MESLFETTVFFFGGGDATKMEISSGKKLKSHQKKIGKLIALPPPKKSPRMPLLVLDLWSYTVL